MEPELITNKLEEIIDQLRFHMACSPLDDIVEQSVEQLQLLYENIEGDL